MPAGGGDSEEELDISLLRITLFHEHWQGLLHELDLAMLRSNSAVAPKPPTSNRASNSSDSTASVSGQSDMDAQLSSSPPASHTPSSSASPEAQNLTQPAASSSSSSLGEEEQRSTASSSSQEASTAGMQAAEELLQEATLQASSKRSGSGAMYCMVVGKPKAFVYGVWLVPSE